MMVTLAAWLHDIDPYAIRITDAFLRWYPVSYLTGFVLGWLMLRWLAGRGLILLSRPFLVDAMLLLGIGVIVGGRLGYVLFYQPSLLWTFEGGFPFWGLLMINRGGMASHGGMIGVVLACWRISRGFKDDQGRVHGACPVMHVFDAVVMVAPVGLMLGRLANFVNGELLGKIVARPGEAGPWWAVRFPQEHLTRHAAELTVGQQEALARLALEHALPNDPEGDRFELAYGRILEKLQAGNAEIAERLEPLVSARHPTQLYQAAAEGLLTLAVVWFVWRKPRVAGVASAWFLITYGVGRVVTELWRLPDDHFGPRVNEAGVEVASSILTAARPLGLSRGQWLSVAMVAAGVGLLVWVTRRAKGGEAEKFGGWLSGRGGVLGVAGPAKPADGEGGGKAGGDEGE